MKYLLIVSILLNGILLYLLFRPEAIDRIPPWHPFQLNSDLTLGSIVDDGYRFASMPCGQVQYTKPLGDTIIQYEVEVDCRSYHGKHEPNFEFGGDEVIPDLNEGERTQEEIEQEKLSARNWEAAVKSNAYYPWTPNEIEGCYQNINWRVFTIVLGQTIDSLFIEDYIRSKDGVVNEHLSDWNARDGGNIVVYYPATSIYFQCSLSRDWSSEESEQWEFRIVRTIPDLDQRAREARQERSKMIGKYYGR